jgi:adenylate cyclase
MGSTSSVGQSCSSDLDIWVCHQSWLDSEERQLLQRKCSLLESWAASLGVEVSFFLIDENRFRHNESGSLGGEDCGSTQHILLLDEFYRTAVRLAGKRILWNMVPGDEEEHYDDYVMTLYAQGVLMAGSRRTQLALRRRVLWRQPLAAVQEYRLPVQSGIENAAAGSLFLGIPESTPVGERY